jgi:hypothetical protein
MITDICNNIINEFVSKGETKRYDQDKKNITFGYAEYSKKTTSLSSYKVLELKTIAKQHKLHVTGTKPILIERIETHFYKTKYAIKIQTRFRQWLVKRCIYMKGPALKNKSICVNDKDFVTMEPLVEIPIENFYSYTDSNQFTYGFDIASLIQSMKKSSKVENPYNRERLSRELTDTIKKLYRICFILFPKFKKENEQLSAAQQPQNETAHMLRNTNFTTEQYVRIARMLDNRRNTISQRITDLFLEIDQLGNYTTPIWFDSLSMTSLIRLYRSMYDIWHYRSQLTNETRRHICPFHTPFTPTIHVVYDHDQIQNACLEVLENLVFTGRDDEHRRLGTFQALTALTLVSIGARTALPWLYESVAM